MKVLIISNNAFSDTQCNGKTLKSFFEYFGAENVAQLYFGSNEYPNQEICKNYYRVTENQVFKSILNFRFTTSNSHLELMKIRESNSYAESALLRLLKRNSSRLRFFREIPWKFNTWDSKDLNNWITKFKPDLIFALLGNNIYVHQVVLKLSERYKLPVAIYFTDDYVINTTANSWTENVHYKQLCKQYEETISRASLAYVIGEKMRDDYMAKYKRTFGLLGNCIDFLKFSHLHPIKLQLDSPIIVSFIGGIHSNRWKSIIRMGNICQSLKVEKKIDLIIKVFTTEEPDTRILKAFDDVGIFWGGSLTSDGVLKQIEQSHFLLHVESFDERYRKYVKYSISTKISECLASNRILIAYGPHEVASMLLIKENGFGCCLTDLDDDDRIKEKLYEIVERYNVYDFSEQYRYAWEHYNKELTYKMLYSEFMKII